jgi:hypothetical protein
MNATVLARLLPLLAAAASTQETAPEPPMVEAAPAVSTPAPAPQPTASPRFMKVELADGQTLHGKLLAENAGAIVLEVSGNSLTLARSQIRFMEEEARVTVKHDGELWAFDPNRTRYFYSPSAMMLKKGEMNFSQKELFFSSFGLGVTDWFSIQVGSVLPAFLAGPSGANFIGAVKLGGAVTENLSLAAGAQTLYIPVVGVAGGFLFGTATYGTPDAHVSVSLGKPFIVGSVGSSMGDALATVSGNLRVSQHAALVTENWLMPSFSSGDLFFLTSGGLRIMGDHLAVDLAGVWMGSGQHGLLTAVPIPWVDLTYNF